MGADLEALCREAATFALKKTAVSGDKNCIQPIGLEEWTEARSKVGASIVKGFAVAEMPKVSWDDIGGLEDVKVCPTARSYLPAVGVGYKWRINRMIAQVT